MLNELSPVEYVEAKNWQHKRQAGQLVIKVCPFCHNAKNHFYMRPEDGVYFCHKCHARGNLWTLRRAMGDIEETIKPAFKKPRYSQTEKDLGGKCNQSL